MPSQDRVQRARGVYEAYAAGDRQFIEDSFSEDLMFSSPVDPHLDRAGYFERCWPGSGQHQAFEFVRLVENGDEVIVTYEMIRPGAPRARNTEVLTFDANGQIRRAEVYFGWNSDGGRS